MVVPYDQLRPEQLCSQDVLQGLRARQAQPLVPSGHGLKRKLEDAEQLIEELRTAQGVQTKTQ